MQANIFRKYDIRGLVDEEITDADVTLLGRALGTFFLQHQARTITLGRDCRTHGPRYRDLLVEGLLSTGINILDLGVCTSPILYFSVHHFASQGGVMITASHNPPQYNGFKIMLGKKTLYGDDIQKLRRLVGEGGFASGRGSLEQSEIIEPYLEYVSGNITLDRPLKIALDGGNGTAGPIAVELFQRLGVEVTPLYCDMDGTFPNHEPDPTVPANLTDVSHAVRQGGLEGGFAYDGDADRLGVVDEKGQSIYGDMLLAIFARAILEEHPGALFISEVKCSKNLYDDIAKHGGRALMYKTGHSLIKEKMVETGALLAGEMSGHMFFKHRWFGFDDGIYASCRLAELMAQNPEPLSAWLADMPPVVSTPELRMECSDEIKFSVVEEVNKLLSPDHEVIDIDGVRLNFPDGWGLVRASNTQPALVLRFEAQSQERMEKIRELMESAIEEAKRRI